MKRVAALLIFAGWLFAGPPAVAQTPPTIRLCVPTSGTVCPLVTATAPLPVTVIGGGGGGLSVQDQAAFTQGSSNMTPVGCEFTDTTTLSTGTQGTIRCTTKRAQIVDVDSTGNQLHADLTSPIVTGGNLIGSVMGPTADGSAAANPPVLVAGTTDGTATGLVAIPKVSAGGLVSVDGSAVTQPVSGTVTNNNAVNVTLTDCSGTVSTGNTAVNAFTAQTMLHGFTIINDDTTEVMWISFTTTAAASTAGSYPIPAPTATTFAGGGSFTSPPGMGTNHALSVVAATNGHKFSCTWW